MKRFVPLGIILVALDQLIKGWVVQTPFFEVNSQIILGFLKIDPLSFSCIFILLILLWLIAVKPTDFKSILGLTLIFSGASANLIDRLTRGGVIDYLSLHIVNLTLKFNLADLIIIIGIGYFILENTLCLSKNPKKL